MVFSFDEDTLNTPDNLKQGGNQQTPDEQAHPDNLIRKENISRISELYNQAHESSYERERRRQNQKQCWELAEQSLFNCAHSSSSSRNLDLDPVHNQQSQIQSTQNLHAVKRCQSVNYASHSSPIYFKVALDRSKDKEPVAHELIKETDMSRLSPKINNQNQVASSVDEYTKSHFFDTKVLKRMTASSPQSVMR